MTDLALDSSTTVRDLFQLSGLQAILDLDGLTEVAINCPFEVWFDRGKGWETEKLPLLSYHLCMDIAKSLAVYAGLTIPIGVENPIASVILPDGERGQIAVPPATKKNIVSMTFRKPSRTRFTLQDYADSGRFSNISGMNMGEVELSDTQKHLLALKAKGDMVEFLKVAVQSNLNIVIVGGTGSGKTAFMKSLVDEYLWHKRLLTVEDVHELELPLHPNHLNLFYKRGGLTPKEIIESCMRMKPDHVLLAELRGDEAWTYLELLNTGHDGSLTTLHANDCRSAPSRIAGLVKQSAVGQTLDMAHIMKTINTSIDVFAFFKHTQLTELYYEPARKNKLLSES